LISFYGENKEHMPRKRKPSQYKPGHIVAAAAAIPIGVAGILGALQLLRKPKPAPAVPLAAPLPAAPPVLPPPLPHIFETKSLRQLKQASEKLKSRVKGKRSTFRTPTATSLRPEFKAEIERYMNAAKVKRLKFELASEPTLLHVLREMVPDEKEAKIILNNNIKILTDWSRVKISKDNGYASVMPYYIGDRNRSPMGLVYMPAMQLIPEAVIKANVPQEHNSLLLLPRTVSNSKGLSRTTLYSANRAVFYVDTNDIISSMSQLKDFLGSRKQAFLRVYADANMQDILKTAGVLNDLDLWVTAMTWQSYYTFGPDFQISNEHLQTRNDFAENPLVFSLLFRAPYNQEQYEVYETLQKAGVLDKTILFACTTSLNVQIMATIANTKETGEQIKKARDGMYNWFDTVERRVSRAIQQISTK